jgi:predicted N-acetyltransferase YhbS
MAAIRGAGRGAATSVREADEADHPAIRDLLADAYQEYESDLPPGGLEYYLSDLLDLEGRAEGSRLLVAERRGRLAGTVTFFPDAAVEGLGWPSGWAGFRALGVDPALRGLGVGRRLTQECFDLARARGAPALCLHTAAFMTAAVTMYEGMGFERAPEYDFDPRDLYPTDLTETISVIAYRVYL